MVERILVTGANGFIASHIVERLLERGFEVVGTVRSVRDKSKIEHLEALPGGGRLKLVAADLTAPDPFGAYTSDVDVILHTASPYVMNVKDPETDLVRPAVHGTRSLLEAAAASSRVRRVVLTSSMAAITDEPDGRVLNEEDWNTKSSLSRNPYYFSKAEAERAAWAFMDEKKPSFDLVVINPFIVIGPSRTQAINTSNQILVDLLKGTYPVVMALTWGFVDVRDVAEAHILAMHAEGAQGRYLCAAETLDMAAVVQSIRSRGFTNGRLPSMKMTSGFGTAMMKLASYGQPKGVGSYLRTHLGRVPRFDNSKIQRDLGLTFRPIETSIHDTLDDLVRWGHIQPPAQA